MPMTAQPRHPESIDSSRAAAAEDHALVSVPAEDRKSGLHLSLSPVSVATALVIFAIGGFTVVLAGFAWGMLAGALTAVLGVFLGKTLGRMSFQTGVSSTITSRFFGFGLRGSSVGSMIFTIMILGFLAMESALLYEGTLLMLDLPDSWLVRIVVYGLMTVAWIGLAIFGLRIALRATGVLTAVTIVVALFMIVQIYVIGDASPLDVFRYAGVVPGGGLSEVGGRDRRHGCHRRHDRAGHRRLRPLLPHQPRRHHPRGRRPDHAEHRDDRPRLADRHRWHADRHRLPDGPRRRPVPAAGRRGRQRVRHDQHRRVLRHLRRLDRIRHDLRRPGQGAGDQLLLGVAVAGEPGQLPDRPQGAARPDGRHRQPHRAGHDRCRHPSSSSSPTLPTWAA